VNFQLIWGRFWEIDEGDGGILSLSGAMLLESLTCHSLMRCGKFRMPQHTGAAVPLHHHDLWLFPSKIKSEHSGQNILRYLPENNTRARK
jgi:hypothetical protein